MSSGSLRGPSDAGGQGRILPKTGDAVEVRDLDHALRRMILHSVKLLSDSQTLEEAHSEDGPGAYLLQLLAAEILLKAGALRERRSFPTVHRIEQLFDLQSTSVQEGVSNAFYSSELQFTPGVMAPLDRQLEILGRNFVKFRYVYEACFPYTEADRHERERAFTEDTLPMAEWDVVYCQELLDILVQQLLAHLSAWAPPGVTSLRWCA